MTVESGVFARKEAERMATHSTVIEVPADQAGKIPPITSNTLQMQHDHVKQVVANPRDRP